MTERDRYIRQLQTISPYGVGAIYDVMGESFAAVDTSFWSETVEVEEPRLAYTLGVRGFRSIRPQDDKQLDDPDFHLTKGMPFVRFPKWMFCPNCRALKMVEGKYPPGSPPTCEQEECRLAPLVPMRWVLACPNGHLSDFPWGDWAHSGLRSSPFACTSKDAFLRFEVGIGRGGLEQLKVRCVAKGCNAWRTLEGIESPEAIGDLKIRCSGTQPWPARCDECAAIPVGTQRGSTNLYFARTVSSIAIPRYADELASPDDARCVRRHQDFNSAVQRYQQSPQQHNPFVGRISQTCGVEPDVVRDLVARGHNQTSEPGWRSMLDLPRGRTPQAELLEQEYQHLARGVTTNPQKRSLFMIEVYERLRGRLPGHAPFTELDDLFERVVKVVKLREVRALTGFSRLAPAVFGSPPADRGFNEESKPIDSEGPDPSDDDTYVQRSDRRFRQYETNELIGARLLTPSLGLPAEWLPAVEVRGEGIFFSVDLEKLSEWESRGDVTRRVDELRTRVDGAYESVTEFGDVGARTVMLHTLSHLLIRQLSFACGYPLAALRERIYAGGKAGDAKQMAGVLIYTAHGDTEGTLGGLIREAEPNRWRKIVTSALVGADWCSADPVCGEGVGAGLFQTMNLAACHACTLVPETSCTMRNQFLDRRLVVGEPASRGTGLFGSVVEEALRNR